jgi:hypothetical protein
VSADGQQWVPLGDVAFDVPSNGYADATSPFALSPGNLPSDFQRPFTGDLSSFSGLRYFSANFDMQELLAGSGGGKWLDISATGLPQVGYIRFSVADDLNPDSKLNFELDAVSIARGAVGDTIIPEPRTATPAAMVILLVAIGWRLNRREMPVVRDLA